MKNYFMGSTGYLNWASIIYDFPSRGVQNPRIDAHIPAGNGSLGYFYPPSTTLPSQPDFTITPSIRIETFREGIDDFEYMLLLRDWIDTAGANDIDTATATALHDEMNQMFNHPARWSVNDEYYLFLIGRIGDEIDKLVYYVTYGEPQTEIAGLTYENDTMTVTVNAQAPYRYILWRATEPGSDAIWSQVDTVLCDLSGPIQLVDSAAALEKAFYKIEPKLP